MELIRNCELVKAEIVNGKRCEMKFYDKENDVLRTVKFNRQSWDPSKGAFVDDPDKESKCEEWTQTYFGCSFDEIPSRTGALKDVYVYDNFNSLWESEEVERPKRFTAPIRSIINTTIEDVVIDTIGIHVLYRYKGDLYESKYTCAEYIKSMKKWIPDPDLKERKYKRFRDIFGCDPEDKDYLIGKMIQVQVKKAFDSYYGEILPLEDVDED